MAPAIPTVQFYTREGCHLCDEALAVVERVRAELPFALDIIDIDQDAELTARYGWEVPVIVVDGRKHAKFRVDAQALRRRLLAPAGTAHVEGEEA